jgi:hypothetical protein
MLSCLVGHYWVNAPSSGPRTIRPGFSLSGSKQQGWDPCPRRTSFQEDQVPVGSEAEVRGKSRPHVRLELNGQGARLLSGLPEALQQVHLGVIIGDSHLLRAEDITAELNRIPMLALDFNDGSHGPAIPNKSFSFSEKRGGSEVAGDWLWGWRKRGYRAGDAGLLKLNCQRDRAGYFPRQPVK